MTGPMIAAAAKICESEPTSQRCIEFYAGPPWWALAIQIVPFAALAGLYFWHEIRKRKRANAQSNPK